MYDDCLEKEVSCFELCCRKERIESKKVYYVFPIAKNRGGTPYSSVKQVVRGIVNDLFCYDSDGNFYGYDVVKIYFSSLSWKEIHEKGTKGIPCLNVTKKGWKLENSLFGTKLSKQLEYYLFGMIIKERIKERFGNKNV